MPKTAVGLFENSGVVDEVVSEIESLGFPRNEVRTIGEPLDMAVTGVMSIPHIDFEVALTRELMRIGAPKSRAEAYVEGVRRGVLVFATGPDEKVDSAGQVMNRHGAAEIEETAGPEPLLPHVSHESITPMHERPVQAGRVLEPAGGACFFVW